MPLINNVNQLNDRIKFEEEKTIVNEETGGKTKGWVEKFSCWCHVKTTTMKDIQAEIGTKYEDTTVFVIRHEMASNISMSDRIDFNGQKLEVVRINPDNAYKEFTVVYGKKK